MGITGLIQFIENASQRKNINDFNGSVMCIDAYCWLHRGVYACSEILAMGGKTDVHIKYCMKYVKMLLDHRIKPILVFDGQHLPAKELTEKKRRESRKQARARATEFLRLGNKTEARKYFNRCVDVSHKMALDLMHECRQLNVDCIVAPYESDAQMAFLNVSGMADYVITEDSDLVLFGCKKILFKLDLQGNCLEVDSSKLHLTMGCSLDKYSFEKFRYMCILSGCDYLDSLPGIGLAKACKFVLKTEESDMSRALDKIPAYLNMRHLEVTEEYKLNFLRANATFMYMFVYDPRIRRMVRLTEPSSEADVELCCNAGSMLDEKKAFQLAIGNLDPFTLQKLADWNPETHQVTATVKKRPDAFVEAIPRHPSIWQSSNCSKFRSTAPRPEQPVQGLITYRQNSISKVENVIILDEVSSVETLAREDDILSTYSTSLLQSPPASKKRKIDENSIEQTTTPEKVAARNPFCLFRNNADESTSLRPLTETVSPVKKPTMTSSSSLMKTPTKSSNAVKTKSNPKCVPNRRLATTTLVLSRFFKKPSIKSDKETTAERVDNSDQMEIKEKFLHVKSLYEKSVNNAPSLPHSDADCVEQKERNENGCTITDGSERVEHNSIIEVISDTDDDQTSTENKTVNKQLTHPKSKPKMSGLRKTKASLTVPANQPRLAQFMFTKRSAL